MKKIEIHLPAIADGEDKSSPLANCIRNNYRHIRKWAKRTLTDSFRVYDRQIKQYPVSIDFYAGRFSVHYFSKQRAFSEPPLELIEEVDKALCSIFGVSSHSIYWRIRSKHKETRQYEKMSALKEFFTVYEYGIQFKVNLIDYLDTGLFLDHRETRRMAASCAKGKRMLNLFAYTCSFSVHAAAAGAALTKSVDMSNTYTSWGRENFIINSLPLENNEIVRADCLKFLDDEIHSGSKYDLIIVDPPTISRSKKMDQLFAVQDDYISLLSKALKLLLPGGIIFFSTNARKFVFDETCFKECSIKEITNQTIPLDFHDKRIHRCWKIVSLHN